MNILEWLESIGAFVLAIYIWLRHNDKVGASIATGLILFGVADFIIRTNYDQDLLSHLASRIRYCSDDPGPFGCFFSGEYERYRAALIAQGPTPEVCKLCNLPHEVVVKPIIKYVPLQETTLIEKDMPQLQALMNQRIEVVAQILGQKVGVDDITSLGTSSIHTSKGDATQYRGVVGRDNFFPQLINYDRSCVNSSEVRILVLDGLVRTITWIGDINKTCFDNLWSPSFGRMVDFKIDERFRGGDANIDTIIRYFDYVDVRLLVVSARPASNDHNHVGLRVSLVSSTFPANNAYDDYAARGIFTDIQALAAQ
jgi:hypothetical protein